MSADMIRCPGCGVIMDLSTFATRPNQVICPLCGTKSMVPAPITVTAQPVPVATGAAASSTTEKPGQSVFEDAAEQQEEASEQEAEQLEEEETPEVEQAPVRREGAGHIRILSAPVGARHAAADARRPAHVADEPSSGYFSRASNASRNESSSSGSSVSTASSTRRQASSALQSSGTSSTASVTAAQQSSVGQDYRSSTYTQTPASQQAFEHQAQASYDDSSQLSAAGADTSTDILASGQWAQAARQYAQQPMVTQQFAQQPLATQQFAQQPLATQQFAQQTMVQPQVLPDEALLPSDAAGLAVASQVDNGDTYVFERQPELQSQDKFDEFWNNMDKPTEEPPRKARKEKAKKKEELSAQLASSKDVKRARVLDIDKQGNAEGIAFALIGLFSSIFAFPPLGLTLCIAALMMNGEEKSHGYRNHHAGSTTAVSVIGIIVNCLILALEVLLIVTIFTTPSVITNYL